MKIIGIDASTIPTRTGLVRAIRTKSGISIECALRGSQENQVVDVVAKWLSQREPALIAIDSPLGWPEALAPALAGHLPGRRILTERRATFARMTERLAGARYVVGADKIAATAHASLELLACLRKRLMCEIPLAWTPGRVSEPSVIEVYPAATLKAHRLYEKGYKTSEVARKKIVAKLFEQKKLFIAAHNNAEKIRGELEASDHVLDAAVCVLAAADFLTSSVISPDLRDLARREGWIWVRSEHAAGIASGRDTDKLHGEDAGPPTPPPRTPPRTARRSPRTGSGSDPRSG